MRRVVVFLVAAVAVVSLVGCGPAGPAVEHNPLLLTAEEVGGELVPLESGDRSAAVAGCGPDEIRYYHAGGPYDEYEEDVVRFDLADRTVSIGFTPYHDYLPDWPVERMRQRLADACELDLIRDSHPGNAWEVVELEGFADEAFAFQAVWWGIESPPGSQEVVPSDPFSQRVDWIRSTARVYGVVGERIVMIRINAESPEPPSEEDLRELWEMQVDKIEAAQADDG